MIEQALSTWYTKDNPLYLDPKHPVIALAGESGELLDLLKKDLFKPNFSWWQCKNCKKTHDTETICRNNVPIIIDELSDYSYYLRILCHQINVSFEELVKKASGYELYDIEVLLVCLNNISSGIAFQCIVRGWSVHEYDLQTATNLFMAILRELDVSLEQVIEMNYKKLNSEESNHGWNGA